MPSSLEAAYETSVVSYRTLRLAHFCIVSMEPVPVSSNSHTWPSEQAHLYL